MHLFQTEDKFSLIYLITLFQLYRLYTVKQKDDLVQQICTKIWKEAGITYLNELPHHSHVTLQKNNEYHKSGQLECNWSTSELSGSHVPVQSVSTIYQPAWS